MTRHTYLYDRQRSKSSLEAVLSAEWDTRRDCALAARFRFGLDEQQFNTLLKEGKLEILKPRATLTLNQHENSTT